MLGRLWLNNAVTADPSKEAPYDRATKVAYSSAKDRKAIFWGKKIKDKANRPSMNPCYRDKRQDIRQENKHVSVICIQFHICTLQWGRCCWSWYVFANRKEKRRLQGRWARYFVFWPSAFKFRPLANQMSWKSTASKILVFSNSAFKFCLLTNQMS